MTTFACVLCNPRLTVRIPSPHRSDLTRSLSEQKSLYLSSCEAKREKAQQQRVQLENSLNGRMGSMAERKAEEARFMRHILRTSAAQSRQMRQAEVEYKHQQVAARAKDAGDEHRKFDLDRSPSTLIEIPTVLVSRVKTAKRYAVQFPSLSLLVPHAMGMHLSVNSVWLRTRRQRKTCRPSMKTRCHSASRPSLGPGRQQ